MQKLAANKLKMVQNRDDKQFADSLYDQKKLLRFQKVYTLLGLALMVGAQFQLEHKHLN